MLKLYLKSKEQFNYVFQKPKKRASKSFALFFRANNLDHPRIGFIISKKNVALAVQRNRIKRVVKEFFRLNYSDLENVDVVFFAYKGLDELLNQEIRECLLKILPLKK